MPFEHRLNSGSMWFKTEKKTETSPDFGGEINIEGKMYFISGWNRTTKNNQEYISVMVKLKNPGQAPYVEPGAVQVRQQPTYQRPPAQQQPPPQQPPVQPHGDLPF